MILCCVKLPFFAMVFDLLSLCFMSYEVFTERFGKISFLQLFLKVMLTIRVYFYLFN